MSDDLLLLLTTDAVSGSRLPAFPGAPRPLLIGAKTDTEAIAAFLNNKPQLSDQSRRTYDKEIRRFVFWLRTVKRKPLEHLVAEDLADFLAFLRDPPPEWCGEKGRQPRLLADGSRNPAYGVIQGPLGDASCRIALLSVKSFLSYLYKAGYLQADPGLAFGNVRLPKNRKIDRYLPEALVGRVLTALLTRPATTPAQVRKKVRDLFLFTLYWQTGARLNEVVQADVDDFRRDEYGHWWLHIRHAKGNKPRRVPVSNSLMALMRDYLSLWGIDVTRSQPGIPLLLSARATGIERLSDDAVSLAIRTACDAAASHAEADGEHGWATRLRAASTHWLRHSMISYHLNARGVAPALIQENAGHADLQTLAAYIHTEDTLRHRALVSDES
jgi:integrase/recombinase XerD